MLAHLILALYERIKPMDPGARRSFVFRSINGYRYLRLKGAPEVLSSIFNETLAAHVVCKACGAFCKMTAYNVACLLLNDSFRCTRCRRKNLFPLSWLL